ncbi:MAG TPA: ADP-ribose pyrophosphatase [Clostridiales bacterium]|nr:ADP-ribose pyrophosphatase [Clostridiales bacterium]
MDAGLVEEPISSEEIFNGKIVHLFRDTVRLPNGKPATREVIRHVGAAAVVPLTDEGNVILVRQYRYPFAQVMLEIPAGKLDPSEEPLVCARRELLEETGYEAAEFVSLGVFYPSVAVLDEKIHLYLARNLTFRAANPDADEFLHVEQRPLNELVEDIMAGGVPDGKTQAAVLKAWNILQEK